MGRLQIARIHGEFYKYEERMQMTNNKGVTLINMMIIVIVLVILTSVSIIGGRNILQNSKESKKQENLTAVQTLVNQISIKQGTAGVITPATSKIYGMPAYGIISGDANTLNDWYILDEAALEEMGIEYLEEDYIVNYKINKVYPMSDYEANNLIISGDK